MAQSHLKLAQRAGLMPTGKISLVVSDAQQSGSQSWESGQCEKPPSEYFATERERVKCRNEKQV